MTKVERLQDVQRALDPLPARPAGDPLGGAPAIAREAGKGHFGYFSNDKFSDVNIFVGKPAGPRGGFPIRFPHLPPVRSAPAQP